MERNGLHLVLEEDEFGYVEIAFERGQVREIDVHCELFILPHLVREQLVELNLAGSGEGAEVGFELLVVIVVDSVVEIVTFDCIPIKS